MSTVFISYSHDSEAHKQRVRALAEHLRGALTGSGVSIVIDQDKLPGGPDEGWLDWSEHQVRDADRVLLVCSERFRDSYEGRTPPGTGLGVAWEAGLIKQAVYSARGLNPKFRVVLFAEEDQSHIPLGLERYHAFRLWESDVDLITWLRAGRTQVTAAGPATIPWPNAPSGVGSGLADRIEEFGHFKSMLCGQSQERILLLRGPSGRGKTILLTRFSDLARQLRVPHAKVDLKGCPRMDDILETIAHDLRNLVPSVNQTRESARARALLEAIERATVPVLLSFDTYEQVSDDVRRWIEGWLLDRIGSCPGLLAVVSGQVIPDRYEHGWGDSAYSFDLPPITRVDDWLDFCARRHARAALVRQHVEALALAAQGEPAQISQLLESLVRRLQ